MVGGSSEFSRAYYFAAGFKSSARTAVHGFFVSSPGSTSNRRCKFRSLTASRRRSKHWTSSGRFVQKFSLNRIIFILIGSFHVPEPWAPRIGSVASTSNYRLSWSILQVTSLMTFENIGMTKPSPSGVRYLTCCDCERGPLGIFDSPNDTAFVAIARVKNEPDLK